MAASELELRKRVLIADSDSKRTAYYRDILGLGQDLDVDGNTTTALMELNEGHLAYRIFVVDEEIASPYCPRNRLLEEAMRRRIPSVWVTSDLDIDKRDRLKLPTGVEVMTRDQAPDLIMGIMALASNVDLKRKV